MDANVQIYNELGALQFDAKSHAFAFVGKGSIAITDHWSGTPYDINSTFQGADGAVQVDYDFDLVFFRCADAFILPANRPYNSDPARTIRAASIFCWNNVPTGFITRWGAAEYTGLASHQVDFWCFRSMKHFTPPAHGYGLQVFNTDGTLCYDSSLRPVQVIDDNRVTTAATGSGRSRSIAAPSFAVMRYGISADAYFSGPPDRTIWANQAIKTQAGGYLQRSFTSPLIHSTALGRLSSIYTGGFLSVDVSNL